MSCGAEAGIATYDVVLGMTQTLITDELPTTVETFVQGAGPLEAVTFDIDGTDVWTAMSDALGDVLIDLPLNDLTTGMHTLTATSTVR